MPAYSFEALDTQGQTRRGVLEADTARAARSQLRAQALVPLDVSPVQRASSGLNTVIWESKVFSTTALAVWTRQLAGLVASGLPLERALTALTDEAETEAQRNLCASLRAEVNAGSSFARALSRHPR
ncbi:MAG: type II secretion system protein GspF, partial [Betaproteobacteria bacterium]|nr:type II secretion system protein GspF [Betaproteobacteria bacterium]